MDVIERIRIDCLNDISRSNIIYTCLLVTTTALEGHHLTFFNLANLIEHIKMSFANVSSFFTTSDDSMLDNVESSTISSGHYFAQGHYENPYQRPNLLARMSKRLGVYLDQLTSYLASQFNEHTATSIASCSVLIIVLSIICCFIMSLMREEERRIKEQYRKLGTGSSQSFIAIEGRERGRGGQSGSQRAANISTSSGGGGGGGDSGHHKGGTFTQLHSPPTTSGRYQKIIDQQSSSLESADPPLTDPPSNSSVSSSTHLLHNHQHTASPSTTNHHRRPNSRSSGGGGKYHCDQHHQVDYQNYSNQHNKVPGDKVRLHELRRETYFGLVRLSRPGCRTVVLLCDAQSRVKLLRKFHQCIYPYRKNKTLQFAFLLIERNIGWYEDLLKSVLSERCPEGFRINPINCIGTVLVLNGFKKFFSVYHASNSRPSSDEEPPSLLLEEALLDNLPEWLERVFAGKVNRYYVESWPDRVQHLY